MIDLTTVIDNNQARAALRELYNDSKRATWNMIKDFDGVDVSLDDFAKTIRTNKKIIIELEQEIAEAQKQLAKLPEGNEKSALSNELQGLIKDLEAERENLKQNEAILGKYMKSYPSLQKEMSMVREEMMALDRAGLRESERYKDLEQELAELSSSYRRVQQEQKRLMSGSGIWDQIHSGLQGVLGMYAAGVGVIGLFTSNTEKLVQIQTKLQAIMSVIIGLSQMQKALHDGNILSIKGLTKITELFSIANKKLSATLQAAGVSARVASFAVKAFYAALTIGLSVIITEAIVWIDKLISKYKDNKKAAEEAAKAQREAFEDYAKSVASKSAETIAKFSALQQKYNALGNDLQAKKRFLVENADAFKELGVKVTSVTDAENLFIKNSEAFKESIIQRAQATAIMSIAAEKYKEAIQNLMQAENLKDGSVSFSESQQEELEERFKEAKKKLKSQNKHYTDQDLFNIQKQVLEDYQEELVGRYDANYHKLMTEAGDIVKRGLEITNISNATLSNAGIESYDPDAAKAEDDARKLAEERAKRMQKISDLTAKLTSDAQQAEIDAMSEGIDKKLAQINLDYDKREAEIRKREEGLRKLQDGILTDKQSAEFSTLRDANTRERESEITNVFKELADAEEEITQREIESMNRYLQNYGTYQEKKLAIARIYAKKISEAQTEGDKRSLEKQQQQELVKIEIDEGHISRAFGDLSKLSAETVEQLIKDMESYREYIISTFDPANIEKFENALQNLKAIQADNQYGILGNFIPSFFKEREIAQQQINAAEELSNELAARKIDAEKKVVEIKRKIADLIKEQTGKEIELSRITEETARNIANQISSNGGDANGISNLVSSLAGANKDLDDVSIKSDKATESLGNLQEAFAAKFSGGNGSFAMIDAIVHGINNTVQGIAGAFHEIKDTAESFGADVSVGSSWDQATTIIDGFAEASEGATKAWDSFKSGDIGGMIQGIVQSFTAWIKAFNKLHDSKYERDIQKIQKQIDALEKAYTKLDRSINKAYSNNAAKLIEQQNEMIEQQKTLIKQQIAAEKAKKNTDKDKVQEWNDVLDELSEKQEDNVAKWQEAITSISFDSFRDSFLDALMDMSSGVDDLTDDFEKKLQRSIFESLMANKYEDQIKKLYEKWANYGDSDDRLTEAEVEELRREQKALAEQIIQDRNSLARTFGWDTGASANAQTATARGFQAMSQDTGDELNGRFTAIQGDVHDIREFITMIAGRGMDQFAQIINIRDIMLQLNGNVGDIRTYTRVLPEMSDTLSSINRKLENI